jgi:hypothetical protein
MATPAIKTGNRQKFYPGDKSRIKGCAEENIKADQMRAEKQSAAPSKKRAKKRD